MQVVCIVAHFVQLGAGTLAAVRHGRARQTSGTEPCEDYRRVMWVLGPRSQYSGKIRLPRNLRYQTRGRHMVKRSSDPRRDSLPTKSNFRYGTQCELWILLPPFASLGAGTRGKFVLSSPREKMGTGDLYRMPQAAVHTGRARQTSGTGPYGDCRWVLWVPGPWSQYSGKIRFIEKRGVQNEGVAMLLNVVVTPASLPRTQT